MTFFGFLGKSKNKGRRYPGGGEVCGDHHSAILYRRDVDSYQAYFMTRHSSLGVSV